MITTKEQESREQCMNMADRIQQLRKARGISQEELAEKIGITRQAVSKWESGQSAPDVDRIIAMSDYFEVTTDYLLKGTEPSIEENGKKPDAGIFAIAGTALNVIGLILAVIIWIEWQRAYSVAVGLILMVLGCMIFGIGMMMSEEQSKKKVEILFWEVNLWILILIPYSVCYNLLDGIKGGFWGRVAPIPLLGNSRILFTGSWLLYFVICLIAECLVLKRTEIKNGLNTLKDMCD